VKGVRQGSTSPFDTRWYGGGRKVEKNAKHTKLNAGITCSPETLPESKPIGGGVIEYYEA